MKKFQFWPDNIEKILNGSKTTTLRTYSVPSGKYLVGNEIFYFHNLGLLNINEVKKLGINIIKTENFDKEPKYKSTKDFLKGKRELYVYQIYRSIS